MLNGIVLQSYCVKNVNKNEVIKSPRLNLIENYSRIEMKIQVRVFV